MPNLKDLLKEMARAYESIRLLLHALENIDHFVNELNIKHPLAKYREVMKELPYVAYALDDFMNETDEN